MNSGELWKRYKEYLFVDRDTGFFLDPSRISFPDNYISQMSEAVSRAISEVEVLEKGGIANPDENRMVGHYWLRNPELAPTPEIRSEIINALTQIKEFTREIHSGAIKGSRGEAFDSVLIIGIGGSALGPQFVAEALRAPHERMKFFYWDNTDPDGFDLVTQLIPSLDRTLVIIISKSGGTTETRNGQLAIKEVLKSHGLTVSKHLVAVTQDGSQLSKTAKEEGWLATFPMWDWVGGRTSELSAVGLLPAALQGIDIDGMLAGARSMDNLTRKQWVRENPAAILALMWNHTTGGKGQKDMVVLPYKDRLLLFSRYLQQLVMESLGKRTDRQGKDVSQGLSVFGNKGSTDQHSFVQQLHDGLDNFFAVFIEVLKDLSPCTGQHDFTSTKVEVEPGVTSGDYLQAYVNGTRLALTNRNRQSITITVPEVTPFTVGQLIALFERTVGIYASLIDINAYHQPGVEFLKKGGAAYIQLQKDLLKLFDEVKTPLSVDDCATRLDKPDSHEPIFKILQHLAANDRLQRTPGQTVFEDVYSTKA